MYEFVYFSQEKNQSLSSDFFKVAVTKRKRYIWFFQSIQLKVWEKELWLFMRSIASMTSIIIIMMVGQEYQIVPFKPLLGKISKSIQFSLIHSPSLHWCPKILPAICLNNWHHFKHSKKPPLFPWWGREESRKKFCFRVFFRHDEADAYHHIWLCG